MIYTLNNMQVKNQKKPNPKKPHINPPHILSQKLSITITHQYSYSIL